MACVTRTTCGSKSSPACCRPFSACIAELSNRALLSQSIPQASIAPWTCGQRQRSVAHMPTAATTATSDQNRLKSPTRLHDEALKRPWSKLATRTDHKPSETVTRNPGGRHQKPCSGSRVPPVDYLDKPSCPSRRQNS